MFGKKKNTGYRNLGGSSFEDDMETGLGKKGVHSNPTKLPSSFGGFGDQDFQQDISSGLSVGRIDNSMSPDWNKKRERKRNILDEWNDRAEGGGF